MASESSGAGLHVAYNLGCGVGCDLVRPGDVVLAFGEGPVGPQPLYSHAELAEVLARGCPLLFVLDRRRETVNNFQVCGTAPGIHPELRHLAPLVTVGVAELERTPAWARKYAYGRAMPPFAAAHIDGGYVDGLTVLGQRTLMVLWPFPESRFHDGRAPRPEFVALYTTLQRARSTLAGAGVEVMFVMGAIGSDTGVRDTLHQIAVQDDSGRRLADLPVFRMQMPELAGFRANADRAQLFAATSPARRVGLERSASHLLQYVFEFPVILVVDEAGVVRWHSEGTRRRGPAATVGAAITFAQTQLEPARRPIEPTGEPGPARIR